MRFGSGRFRSRYSRCIGVDDAEVADRQHVGPMQPEHQEHLRRPAPESLHRRQPLDHLLVRQRSSSSRLQPAVSEARAEIPQVPTFWPLNPTPRSAASSSAAIVAAR